MEIKTINGHTRTLGAPSNWDQSKGECVGLPVIDSVTENGPAMISEWSPESDDLKLLNMGMPLHLWVFGDTHPVVSISVGQPTQEAIDKAALEAPFNPDWDIKKAHRESMIEAGVLIGNLEAEIKTLTAERDELKRSIPGNKSIGKLHMVLHTSTALLRKTITDLIECDDEAAHSDNVAQYRSKFIRALEKKLADNILYNYDIAIMPRALTAENGAKAALIGEFFVPIQVACNQCDNEGTLSDGTECSDCEGTGVVVDHESIEWTTIKAIYAKAIEVCEVRNLP